MDPAVRSVSTLFEPEASKTCQQMIKADDLLSLAPLGLKSSLIICEG